MTENVPYVRNTLVNDDPGAVMPNDIPIGGLVKMGAHICIRAWTASGPDICLLVSLQDGTTWTAEGKFLRTNHWGLHRVTEPVTIGPSWEEHA
jgi:hypothetical protein